MSRMNSEVTYSYSDKCFGTHSAAFHSADGTMPKAYYESNQRVFELNCKVNHLTWIWLSIHSTCRRRKCSSRYIIFFRRRSIDFAVNTLKLKMKVGSKSTACLLSSKSVATVVRAPKKRKMVSMPPYLWTWEYTQTETKTKTSTLKQPKALAVMQSVAKRRNSSCTVHLIQRHFVLPKEGFLFVAGNATWSCGISLTAV